MGWDKKIMLKKWPEISATAIKIWRDFDALYTEISQNHPAEEQLIASGFFKKALKNVMMTAGAFTCGDQTNGMPQKMSSFWENTLSTWLITKEKQGLTTNEGQIIRMFIYMKAGKNEQRFT